MTLDEWFAVEILPHEPALMRFLARHWRDPTELCDLRQEIYVRLYEAAKVSRPRQPRAFLFATARNLMSDRIRRGRVVSFEVVADFEASNVFIDDDHSPERQESARQELQRLTNALIRLPPRCREVIWLRRVKGLSQKEVASTMHIAEGTVEKQVAKGMRLLAQMLSEETDPLEARSEASLSLLDAVGRTRKD